MRLPSPHEDAWPFIAKHLPAAVREAQMILTDPKLLALAEKRFRENDPLYGSSWMERDSDWFDVMADEEAADLIAYLAMRRVLR